MLASDSIDSICYTYLEDELLINIAFGYVGIEIGALDEAEKELVNNL